MPEHSSFYDHLGEIKKGIIDSTGVLELVTFLEEEFLIQVDDHELIPENLDSINNIISFIQKKVKDVIKNAN